MDRLLLDIGASSIKSIHQYKEEIVLDTFHATESFSIKHGDKFNPRIIIKEFKEHVQHQFLKRAFSEIWLCAEMHNFVAFDEDTNKLSDFFSWRFSDLSNPHTKNIIHTFSPLKNITGQSLKPGLPLFNFAQLDLDRHKTYRIFSLPEFIVFHEGELLHKLDKSMAASMGCFDIQNNSWMLDNLEKVFPNTTFKFSECFSGTEKPLLGTIQIQNKAISILGGYGDLQTSLYGANLDKESLVVNMGTGSQVSRLYVPNNNKDQYIDIKPFFEKKLQTITHIPAGRTFNYLNSNYFRDTNFWENLNSINYKSGKIPKLTVDLNIFESNWKYKKNLFENLNLKKHKLSSIYESILWEFCCQYIEAIDILNTDNLRSLIICGGMLKKIHFVQQFFNCQEQFSTNFPTFPIDETLVGLHLISLKYQIDS